MQLSPDGGATLAPRREGDLAAMHAAYNRGLYFDDGPASECTQEFPLHSTSRIVAGGPLRGGVYKCALQSVDDAIANGVYGSWTPSAAEVARLKEIFPTGVCDYSQGDAGRP